METQLEYVIEQLESLIVTTNETIENTPDYAKKLYHHGYKQGIEMALSIINSINIKKEVIYEKKNSLYSNKH